MNENTAQYYNRLYTKDQLKSQLLNYENLLSGLESGKIPAIRIIGNGVKAPKKQARIYLNTCISNYKEAIAYE